jgi:hypothetical protein
MANAQPKARRLAKKLDIENLEAYAQKAVFG